MWHAVKRVSVLHILAPAPFGGLESIVQTMVAGQIAEGDDVQVAAVVEEGRDEHPFLTAMREKNLPVIPVRSTGRRYWEERAAIGSILERVKADIVHTHGYRPDVLDAPVARRKRLPTVTTVHGFTGGGRKNRLYEWLQRKAFSEFSAVVAVSAKLRDELLERGLSEETVHLVRNAWEPSRAFVSRKQARTQLGIPADAEVMAWVGRMSPEKAPDIMVRAFARTRRQGLCLSMVGSGALKRKCEELAGSLGVAEKCQWHGVVPDVGRLFKAFDAVVITSWTEGTPIVLLEAMAAGVPIVTTSVGGIPDVVSAREATLVPPGDIGGLADGMETAVSDEAAARARATAARQRLEEDFAVEPWVRRYREIYLHVMGV